MTPASPCWLVINTATTRPVIACASATTRSATPWNTTLMVNLTMTERSPPTTRCPSCARCHLPERSPRMPALSSSGLRCHPRRGRQPPLPRPPILPTPRGRPGPRTRRGRRNRPGLPMRLLGPSHRPGRRRRPPYRLHPPVLRLPMRAASSSIAAPPEPPVGIGCRWAPARTRSSAAKHTRCCPFRCLPLPPRALVRPRAQ